MYKKKVQEWSGCMLPRTLLHGDEYMIVRDQSNNYFHWPLKLAHCGGGGAVGSVWSMHQPDYYDSSFLVAIFISRKQIEFVCKLYLLNTTKFKYQPYTF